MESSRKELTDAETREKPRVRESVSVRAIAVRSLPPVEIMWPEQPYRVPCLW